MPEYIHHVNENSNMLNLISYNIRSFNANSTAFLPIVEQSTPDVIILSETWYTDDFQANIDNYEAHHIVRSDRQSGGISVYVDDSIRSRRIDELSFANLNIEVCTVQLLLDAETIFVIGIYRPHIGTIEAFSSELEIILQNSLIRNKKCITAGDINLCLMRNNNDTSRFVGSHAIFTFLSSYYETD